MESKSQNDPGEAFSGPSSDPAEDEDFLRLLQVIRDDPAERKKVLSILELQGEPRMRAVNILLITMRKEKAPPNFIRAWERLMDENVAEAARRIIEEVDKGNKESRRELWLTIAALILCVAVFAGMIWLAWEKVKNFR